MQKFRDLGLSEATIAALERKGFEEPTPIQQKAIPLLMSGTADIVGQAQTGTGKTAAFGLPIIEKAEEKSKHIQALILTPTRELAIQVADEINSYKGGKKLSIVPIYGGQSMSLQLERLRRGVDVVTGTPGRIIDHLQRRTLDLSKVKFVVLDEADEMLNMGFIDDVDLILQKTGKDRRTLLFSATMPSRILDLAKKHMGKYELISVKKEQLTTPLTDQIYFEVKNHDKFDALCRIIDVEKEFYGLVFCRTKVDCDKVAQKLDERGYGAATIHGDISQPQREKILNKFRQRKMHILVATDVAARGIDIVDLTHVINYSLPEDPESYVHRIGRTGRAGKAGTAITFITPSEFRRLAFIKKAANADIRKGTLPGHREVVETRMKRIHQEVGEIISGKQFSDYNDLAAMLLKDHSPEETVAALLKHTFQVALNPGQPDALNQGSSPKVDMAGKTRLFVAMGKKDKLTVQTLAEFISTETGIDMSKIGQVEVYDTFSFINAPFEEAEKILEVFTKKYGKKTPLVERARAEKKEKGEKSFRKKTEGKTRGFRADKKKAAPLERTGKRKRKKIR
ncbi:MAG: DEAD/DEAH box helicase [Bacteroidia bacterium]